MPAVPIPKLHGGRPSSVNASKSRESGLIITTLAGKMSKHDDADTRQAASKFKTPYIITLVRGLAVAWGLAAGAGGGAGRLPAGRYQELREKKPRRAWRPPCS